MASGKKCEVKFLKMKKICFSVKETLCASFFLHLYSGRLFRFSLFCHLKNFDIAVDILLKYSMAELGVLKKLI